MASTAAQLTPDRPFRLWPYLAVNLVAAVWIDLTSFQWLQTSDSLLFVLGSLYEWRFFFWEQDRIGMLIPLLASFCKSPFHNLLVQSGAMIFCGLTLPVLLARVLTPHRMAPLAVTFANAAFVLLAPTNFHVTWLMVCNYPSSLCLGLFAIGLIDGRPPGASPWQWAFRSAGCLLFLLLALWQYYGALLFLGPLVVARAWWGTGPGAPVRRRGWQVLFRPLLDSRALIVVPLMLAAFGAIQLLMWHVRQSSKDLIEPASHGELPVERWGEVWGKMIDTSASLPNADEYACWLGGLCASGFLFSLLFGRRMLWGLFLAVAPAMATAALEIGFLGTREWMIRNVYHPRYLVAVITTLVVSVSLLGLVPVLARIPRPREPIAVLLGLLLLLTAATVRYGWPSVSGVRTLMDRKCGALTPLVLETNCEAVGGEYWVVWQAMFHVNMTLYERGEDRVVFGVGSRCSPMHNRWADYPDGFRVVMPSDDLNSIEMHTVHRGLDLFEKLEERGMILVPSHPDTEPKLLRIGIYRGLGVK